MAKISTALVALTARPHPNPVLRRRLLALMWEQHTNGLVLAARAGLNSSAVFDIIEGRSKRPRRATLERIGGALNVTVAFLVGRSDRKR